MYLVVDQRLSVSDRMLYPVVAFVPVVYNGNSFRVVGYPYPLFFININVIDVIAVHLIVAFVAGDDVRFRDTRVHVDLCIPIPSVAINSSVWFRGLIRAMFTSLKSVLECIIRCCRMS